VTARVEDLALHPETVTPQVDPHSSCPFSRHRNLPITTPRGATVGLRAPVLDLQVEAGPRASRAAAERLGPVVVGEHVLAAPPPLHHSQGSVRDHPSQQVGHLASPAADVGPKRPLPQHQR
jgi:hypothetical protein